VDLNLNEWVDNVALFIGLVWFWYLLSTYDLNLQLHDWLVHAGSLGIELVMYVIHELGLQDVAAGGPTV
jgi:hypothetical protein